MFEVDTAKVEIVFFLPRFSCCEHTGQKAKTMLERITEGTVIFAQVQTPSAKEMCRKRNVTV